MANLNKVMLIGRLTNKPESFVFANGGKVVKFRFAVNNRKKNQQTGQWEEEPVYLDLEAFNRGDFNKLADRVEQYLDKGRQIFLEGHLKLDTWKDKQTGENRSRLKIVMENFQFLDSRQDGGNSMEGQRGSQPTRQSDMAPSGNDFDPGPGSDGPMDPSPPGPGEQDIPF